MQEKSQTPSETIITASGIYKNFTMQQRGNSIKTAIVNIFKPKQHKPAKLYKALQDINFQVNKGDFFGIVGRNGSGKSTLLKILAGIYQPSKGSVKVQGKLVPFIELGVGFNPELTGRENVFLNGALLGFSNKEIAAKYQEIVDFAELEEFMDQKLKNYSSGMQVRLAFSVATRAEADILLVDEVLAVGDADFQRKCFDYFKELKRKGKTVVFVSHDMTAVQQYCNKAVLIEDSKIIDSGKPSKIAQEYLKLFADQVEQEVKQEGTSKHRWGNGKATITKLSVSSTPKEITVREEIIFKESLEDPVFGMGIQTAMGEMPTGTNTKQQGIKTGSFAPGDKLRITWRVPNILATGKFFIHASVIDTSGASVYDWWDEATEFKINKLHNLPFTIDPGFDIQFDH